MGLPNFGGNLEIEIVVHIAIEIDLAGLHELHDGRPGEHLRDRTGTEHGLVGNDGAALGDVGITVALRKQDLPVLDDHEDGARDISPRHGVRKQSVGERLDIVRREVVGLRRHGRKRCRGACMRRRRDRGCGAGGRGGGVGNADRENSQHGGQNGELLEHFILP